MAGIASLSIFDQYCIISSIETFCQKTCLQNFTKVDKAFGHTLTVSNEHFLRSPYSKSISLALLVHPITAEIIFEVFHLTIQDGFVKARDQDAGERAARAC